MKQTNYLLSVIDILGYKGLCTMEGNDNHLETLSNVVDELVDFNVHYDSLSPHFGIKTYTDNFLIYLPLDYSDFGSSKYREFWNRTHRYLGENLPEPQNRIKKAVYHHILNLAHNQFNLAVNNLFIRGASVIGLAYIDENKVFGDALIRAHMIESELAIYPRIILDTTIINNLQLRADWNAIIKDIDGLYYVDFLTVICDLILGPPNYFKNDGTTRAISLLSYPASGVSGSFYDELLLIRNNIIKNIESHADEKVTLKYIWLSDYFNSFCRKRIELFNDFIIK